MATTLGSGNGEGALPAGTENAMPSECAASSPQFLLQQLHQVQEELERYYLKCLDLDAERQLACVARDDARREIDALRLQLHHMQRTLHDATPHLPESRFRRLITRVTHRRRTGTRDGEKRCIETLRASSWFDADWYLAQYPDVRLAGMDPVEHYHEFGWKEARNPGPGFDTAWYLRNNPDVAATGTNPLLHFVEHGHAEGRTPRAM